MWLGHGMVVGVAGAFCGKSATVFDDNMELTFLHPFAPLPHAVRPVVAAALHAPQGKARRKLAEALQVLVRVDPCALSHVDTESGQTLLLGSGELHLEVCLSNLRELCGGDEASVTMSPPLVCFRESCCILTAEGDGQMGKSANKLNRIFVRCFALGDGDVERLEDHPHDPSGSSSAKVAGELLGVAAKDVWAVGPAEPAADSRGPSCVLVNRTTGVERAQIANVQDHLTAAFQQVSLHGPLAHQRLRGVVFEVMGGKIHQDRKHYSPAQIVPAASRAMQAALLAASPTLQEPLYSLSVQVQSTLAGKIFGELRQANAFQMAQQCNDDGQDLIEGLLPVRCAFGLSERLHGLTGGRALLHLAPGGWARVQGDPYNEAPDSVAQAANNTYTLVAELRLKAGLPPELPTAKSTADRL
jgi:elongation factor 2